MVELRRGDSHRQRTKAKNIMEITTEKTNKVLKNIFWIDSRQSITKRILFFHIRFRTIKLP